MCWLYAITKYRYVPSLNEILLAIDDARRMGFEYMELEGVGPQLHLVAEKRAIIKEKCRENGVTLIDFVPVLPDIMSVEPEKRRKALKDFRLGCELGAYFETGMVQADTFHLPIHTEPPYDVSKEFQYAYKPPPVRVEPSFYFWKFFDEVLVPSISECNDMAKDHGLKLCIEPRTWENIPNAWALELLMRRIGDRNLGAVLDVAHLAAQKMQPVLCIEMLGGKIFYVHASDSNYLTEDHLEIGKGNIDWVSVLRALQKHQYRGYIGIDIGGKPELKPVLDVIYINSKIYLEKLMSS
ncbi:MAG: sugar phosphate isomerase/epimerase family protein [Nitrososphaerota archaeon]